MFFRSWCSFQRIPSLELFQRAAKSGASTAIISNGSNFSYRQLLHDSQKLSERLRLSIGSIRSADLQECRVAFLCPSTYEYVATQWAIWSAGGVAVPLTSHHPPAELEYYIRDSRASIVVGHHFSSKILQSIAEKCGAVYVEISDIAPSQEHFHSLDLSKSSLALSPSRRAMIIYTSGTTGKPKGVVSTHAMIEAQIRSMIEPWGWSSSDHILNVLPLHHVHGVINVLACGLWAGATITMLPKFDAGIVWKHFRSVANLNVFMAVPTVYSKLISVYDAMSPEERTESSVACSRFRLMVSGSAALPQPILERWKNISNHTLLERYGMTEIGMALSNSLHGIRKPGFVGKPLPGVQVKIDGDPKDGGELLVKGPSVFSEYWNKPDASATSFDSDGWFKTGDIAAVDDSGDYRLIGRASVDVIKSGGYKISALEIERVLLEHPEIEECAVLGVPDNSGVYGEDVCAMVVLKPGSIGLSLTSLNQWCKSRIASYKSPRQLLIVPEIPRNAMGKVNKKALRTHFNRM